MAFERQAFGVSPPIPSDRERYVDAAPFEGAFVTPTIRLVRALARGGMGSVWLAEHLALGAPVAVKFMSEATVESRAARELFQQEAAALAKIRSPHVVQVFDFGVTSASLPYIVMELLEGETLQDRIERFGRLSPRLTVEIVRQLGLALSRAHELGIVHRDIKPENVFLVDHGAGAFVKLLDFGIASQVGAATDDVAGTPHFMAPEQMAGAAVGPSADVWSLGVVAYYCLSGRLPFAGRSLGSISASARHGAAPLAGYLSEPMLGFERWIAGALEPDPFLRYPDASDALGALTRLLAGTALELEAAPRRRSVEPSIEAIEREAVVASRRAARRRMASRVGGGLCIALVAFFGAFAAWARPREAVAAARPVIDWLSVVESRAAGWLEPPRDP